MIQINNLCKSFGKEKVLDNVSMEFQSGEVIVIIGPSGSGKTTLLRCINFLETADSGTLSINDYKIDFSNCDHKSKKEMRNKTAMVFQNYNLFNNLTAMQNITEPLRFSKKMSKKDAEAKTVDLLDKVGLSDRKNFYPKQLSGGQKQRVGIARAMAVSPELLLLDEPTSALDPSLVGEVTSTINELAKNGQTMLIITHDMNLARKVGTKILYMRDGRIIDEGLPAEWSVVL